jgi:hypothetical protein
MGCTVKIKTKKLNQKQYAGIIALPRENLIWSQLAAGANTQGSLNA